MKHVKHCYLELLPNKTVVMVIKTFEEGVKYKINHPGMIEVGESNNIDEWRECIVQVPTFDAFWKEELTFMQYSSVQNKDEIRIYYNPVPALIYLKNQILFMIKLIK